MDAETARRQAQTAVLDGVAAGTPLAQIEAAVAACSVRGVYTPDIAMLELVIAALDVAGATAINLLVEDE